MTEQPYQQSAKDIASQRLQSLFPPVSECAELVVSCPTAQYSASRLAMAVEDAEAHVLNLNVTAGTTGRYGDMQAPATVVELRVSSAEVSSVARSVERYGYEVVRTTPEDDHIDSLSETARQRVASLLRMMDL